MDLLYIHGAPAVGKLTVAQALLQTCAGRLFDNHVTLGMAEALFPFGTDGFWELVHGTRRLAIEAAAKTDLPLMVMTSCYCDPESVPIYASYKRIVAQHGGRVMPVYLTCEPALMAQRVTDPIRQQRRKIGTAKTLDSYLSNKMITAVPDSSCLHLSTDTASARETAARIAQQFDLALS